MEGVPLARSFIIITFFDLGFRYSHRPLFRCVSKGLSMEKDTFMEDTLPPSSKKPVCINSSTNLRTLNCEKWEAYDCLAVN